MARAISLFSGYSQDENRNTNYCLLLLRLLYEENPKFLEEALNGITGGQMGSLGVEFSQQQRQRSGIPDGVIQQVPFTIYIETKNFDWFYDDQLERHLDDLNEDQPGQKILIALAPFKDGYEGRFNKIERLCAEKYDGQIVFSALSFEEFISEVRIDDLPKNLANQVDELEAYFDQEDLLPNWKHKLDVCNCARTIQEQTEHNVYICPAQGGAYSHKRCRYFGAYKNKAARYIAEIAGVVDVEPGLDGDADVLWNNRQDLYDNDQLAEEAKSRKLEARPNIEYSARTFVLENLNPSAFRKESSGAMRGSKRYFDVGDLDADSVSELASALEAHSWEDLD
jgi:hypothetical protein